MQISHSRKYWTLSLLGFVVWVIIFIFHWLVGSPPQLKTLAVWLLFYFIGWLLATITSSVYK
jgi:hypothetical protein